MGNDSYWGLSQDLLEGGERIYIYLCCCHHDHEWYSIGRTSFYCEVIVALSVLLPLYANIHTLHTLGVVFLDTKDQRSDGAIETAKTLPTAVFPEQQELHLK